MTPRPPVDLSRLVSSWLIELRAARKSPATIRAYEISVTAFLHAHDELTKDTVIAWLASMADGEAATARLRLAALKQWCKWLSAEEGINADAILLISPPKLAGKAVPALPEDEIADMLKACAGRDWRSRRDKAMLLVLAECGLRRGELLALNVADVDTLACSLLVVSGKGNKARRVRFSTGTAAAIDRYQRSAGVHDGALFVGNKHTRLTVGGLTHALAGRAAAAGVKNFHPHRLRHSMAVRWLARGGSETGLMATGGWTDRTMIDRYVGANREQIAAEEFDRLNMGLT